MNPLNRRSEDFQGYELLLLLRLQTDPFFWHEWTTKLQQKILEKDFDLGEVPSCLWYLALTIDYKKERMVKFIQEQVEKSKENTCSFIKCRDTLLSGYLNSHQFTELHLDGIFKYGDYNTLPVEIFKCTSVRRLSLKYNYLHTIPPDIGRLSKLEILALTNNKLQNKSLPFTMTFCSKLRMLYLDNNLLDALPGFLLKMSSLETVHRHGNHNYFKSTFMWYHTDVNERVLRLGGCSDYIAKEPQTLQFWAAKSVIGSKINFYSDDEVAMLLKDYISDIYGLFNVCELCNIARLWNCPGYKVITFKNPYLGNTCVPFQHWACSLKCAQSIEVPARINQISMAEDLDRRYENYIRECQKVSSRKRRKRDSIHTSESNFMMTPGVSSEFDLQQLAMSQDIKANCCSLM